MIVSKASSIGKRTAQQDVALVKTHGLQTYAVLCDGMGGHADGAGAAQRAATAALRQIEISDVPVQDRLSDAANHADRAVSDGRSHKPEGEVSGTTLIAAILEQGSIHWISIGDSLILRLRGNTVTRLNADHSMSPLIDAMAASGELSEEEAKAHPDRNMLLFALTGVGVERSDLAQADLIAGDIIVIASDGLLTLDRAQIAQVLAAADPNHLAQALVSAVLAQDAENQDNVCVIAAQLSAPKKPITRPIGFVSNTARQGAV